MLILDTKCQRAALVRHEDGMTVRVDVLHELFYVATMLGTVSGHRCG